MFSFFFKRYFFHKVRSKDTKCVISTVRFRNLSLDPPSYPKTFFTTGSTVGAWVGMRAHMQEKKGFEKLGRFKYCRLFFSASGGKMVRHKVRMNDPAFSSSFDVIGKGCIVCKNKSRRAWSKCSLPKMERLKNPHCGGKLVTLGDCHGQFVIEQSEFA